MVPWKTASFMDFHGIPCLTLITSHLILSSHSLPSQATITSTTHLWVSRRENSPHLLHKKDWVLTFWRRRRKSHPRMESQSQWTNQRNNNVLVLCFFHSSQDSLIHWYAIGISLLVTKGTGKQFKRTLFRMYLFRCQNRTASSMSIVEPASHSFFPTQ